MAKINAKGIKEVLTSRYEILALVIGAVLVMVCLVWGVTILLGAGSPVDEMVQTKNELMKRREMNPPPPRTHLEKPNIDWEPVTKKQANLWGRSWFERGTGDSTGRFNPRILPLDVGENGEGVQVDYLHHGIHTYELSASQDKIQTFAGAGAVPGVPCYLAVAKRIVVVNLTFSYAEQAEIHRKALHLDKLEELYGRGYGPTFEGLNVQRRKYKGKWEDSPWESLYNYDAETDKITVAPWLEKLFKTAVIDDGQGDLYKDVIQGAAVTPLPRLTDDAIYPPVELPGIGSRKKQTAPPPPPKDKKEDLVPQRKSGADFRPLGKAPLRQPPAPADKAEKTSGSDITKINDDNLKDQLAGKINWFNPYGTFTEDPAKVFKPDIAPPQGFKSPEDEMKDDYVYNFKCRMYPPTNDKALIRFIDVDVEPGAFYQYRVQLRFANPNYKQPVKMLAHSGLAEQKELVSAWQDLSPIAVPTTEADFRFYITHFKGQAKDYINRATQGKQHIDFNNKSSPETYVPFQVFKFVDMADSQEIADWVVAERLLVGRGEPIGRKCDLEVAVWQKYRTTRESAGTPKGVMVDMSVKPSVVLLDFSGGYSQPIKSPRTGANLGADDSEYQALLLMPDMTMKMRNSRDDYEEKSPRVLERRALFETWKARLEEARPQVKKDKGK